MKTSCFSKIIALALVSLMLLGAVGCDMASIFGDMLVDEGNGINQADTSILGKYTGKSTDSKNDAEETGEETAESPTEMIGEETDVRENEDTAEIEFSVPLGDLDFEGEEISILCAIQQNIPNEWQFTAAEDQVDNTFTFGSRNLCFSTFRHFQKLT